MDIKGTVAVITGGASGLGRGTVERFIADGARVAIFDMNERLGVEVATSMGGNCTYYSVNVVDTESVQAALDDVVAKWAAVHICCNFAGIGSAFKTYGANGPHPIEEYIRLINVNQIGTFNVCRLVAEKMAANHPVTADGGRGVIINTASIAAYEGQVGQVAYSASKGAIVGMCLPMARDLSAYGIRVNTIVPGLIHTPLFDTIEGEYYRSLAASVVYPKRLGKPIEIAKLAAFLVDNDYMNGECIRMDGAIRMQPK